MEQSIRTPWFYPAQGVIFGAVLVTALLAPRVWVGVACLLGIVSLNALGRLRNVRMGRPPTAWQRDPAVVWVSLLVPGAVIVAATWYLVAEQGLGWVAWVGGFAIVALFSGIGVLADRTRAEPPAVTP